MTVFVYAPDKPQLPAIAQRINAIIPAGNAYLLPGGVWIISYEGTSRALSDAIGLSEGTPSSGVVFAASSYWGHAAKDVWEWLGTKTK